ncbi:DUF928 domain-containing protein [Dapis sp. BLCC M126]|uniref:DUF928 domain-containing protein n=1 Tax=Dapis sp. BLCC M126 TaxID=3400189 RepID=UPI003CF8D358
MKYLSLIASLSVTILIKLWGIDAILQKPVLAIATFRNISSSWKISQMYTPPDRGAPPTTTPTGTRGSCALSKEKNLLLLIPENNIGLTLSKYPTFFVYIPPYKDAQEAEFFITDAENNNIYNHRLQLPEKSGIIKIKLPEKKSPPLEVGKEYTWGIQIFCQPDTGDHSGDAFSRGFIERIEPNIYLVEKLKKAKPLTVPSIYASQGIWYDALESIVELRRLNLNNPKLIHDWQELFNSANSHGKEELIPAPILDCCETED